MQARGLVDLLVPRGGAGLIRTVVESRTVPVIETGIGNCHVYVDAAADLAQALAIVLNAKTRRVGVCNAAETLLVHAAAAADFLPLALAALAAAGVRLHVDERTASAAADLGVDVVPATDRDWADEYLSMRPRGRRRRLPRRRGRAHPPLVERAHRGDRARPTCGPPTGSSPGRLRRR